MITEKFLRKAVWVFCLMPAFAFAEVVPVKSFHVNIQLLLPGKPYDVDWKNLCKLLAKSMAPGSGPWGFGIFRTASCFLGTKLTAGSAEVSSQDAWILQMSVAENVTQLRLFPPAPRKTRQEQVALGPQAQLLFPASSELPGALKSAPFVQLAGAYLLDGLPFFSQVTKSNAKNFETALNPAPPQLLPPSPTEIEYLDLREDEDTGDVRVKVLEKSEVPKALSGGNVWAGNKAGAQALQPELLARMKAELLRREKISEAAARKKQEEELQKQAEARAREKAAREQAERDKLEEVEEEDDGPVIPLSYGSEAWGGFWPQKVLGSKAQKMDAGAQFEASRGVTNRFSMGVDFQSWKKTGTQLSSFRGWAGWTLGVEGIAFIHSLELSQALGFAKVKFETGSTLKPGTSLVISESLYPLYHVELGIVIEQDKFRFKPFGGYDTALGAASEFNIASGGLDVGYVYSTKRFAERTLVSSVFLKYLFQQSYFRDAKLVKENLGEVFDNVFTHSTSLGVRFTW